MTEPTPTVPAAPDAQASAQARLDAIVNDRSHVYNTGHHGYEAAEAEVLGLRRLLLGADNRATVEYREGEPDRPPVASHVSVPISTSYTRDDFLQAVPGEWGIPEARRAADAIDAIGATPFEGVQLVNLTLGPVPDPADELDLTAVWGNAVDDNVRAVNRMLTQLRAVDEDLHDRLLPYIQRRANVANRVLAIAQRLAGGDWERRLKARYAQGGDR